MPREIAGFRWEAAVLWQIRRKAVIERA